MTTTISDDDLATLRSELAGAALRPGEPGYDDARAGWNLNVDHRPAVVVRARTARDLAAAVRFARTHELELAVQCTGHGAVLACRGVLVDTSSMRGISIDRDARLATVEPGVTWDAFNREAHRHGLVGLGGFVQGVGVVGHSLGGGIGWLSRAFGFTANAIVGATVVLPDGAIVDAGEPEHAGLRWALRGGSGNFGVVASLTFRCFPVTSVYGGSLVFPFEAAREVFARFASWSKDLPDACSTSLSVVKMPDDPHVPEATRGRTIVTLGVCFIGDASEGEALMAPWAALRPATRDLGRVETSDLHTIEAGPATPMRVRSLCREVVDLDASVTEPIVAAFERPSTLRMVEVRLLGGALARPDADGAVRDLGARYVLQIQAPRGDASTGDPSGSAADDLAARLAGVATGGAYLGFLPDGPEGVAATPSAYDPAVWRRLRECKTTYDPRNVLHLNYNVPPL